jgi:hypothetical protein
VIRYLSYQVERAEATAKQDTAKLLLMDTDEAPEIPAPYLLLRKLRLFGGEDGPIPFPCEGGYLDQPHLLILALEACITAEKRFKAKRQADELAALAKDNEDGTVQAPQDW